MSQDFGSHGPFWSFGPLDLWELGSLLWLEGRFLIRSGLSFNLRSRLTSSAFGCGYLDELLVGLAAVYSLLEVISFIFLSFLSQVTCPLGLLFLSLLGSCPLSLDQFSISPGP